MLRTYKDYTFHLSLPTASSRVIFSSYPGIISSVDDFYITDAKMAVMETTNEYFGNALNQYVTPQGTLSWVRAILANRLTSNGEDWGKTFSQYNSGTYNNQWMVVDYKLFRPYQPLQPGTFWIVEQIPGTIKMGDMTQSLAFGYWPSYNIPYFYEIYNKSEFQSMVTTYGQWFTYNLSPRAKIFRRDQDNIWTLDDFKHMMQYNDWQNDPYSEGNAGNQIASRFDLVVKPNNPNPFLVKAPFGAIDSKVTSSDLIERMLSAAISGPSHEYEKPFSWALWPGVVHLGQPTVFDFDWQLMDFN